MFFEYALDPRVVANWGERKNYRFYIRAFKFGQGRLVSRYPKKWIRRVWESFEPTSEMERKRLEALLLELKRIMIKRVDIRWNDKYDWLNNTLIEHERFAFYAILARNCSDCSNVVITEDEIDYGHDLWDLPHDTPVRRSAKEVVRKISGLFLYSKWIRFVDPYISKRCEKYKRPISTFLRALATNRPVGPPVSVELHTRDCGATTDFLRQHYNEIIPDVLEVTLFLWREKDNGQKFHNRYILSDIGGIAFGHGLDEGKGSEMDYLTRLGQEQYDLCCKQYNRNSHVFDLVGDPIVFTKKQSLP